MKKEREGLHLNIQSQYPRSHRHQTRLPENDSATKSVTEGRKEEEEREEREKKERKENIERKRERDRREREE